MLSDAIPERALNEFRRAEKANAGVLAARGHVEEARSQLGRYLDSGPGENRQQVEAWISSLR